MPRKAALPFADASLPRIPKLTHHKASGRAVVCLNGRDCYCGAWGTKAAKAEYDRLIGKWLANGRRLEANEDLRVAELIARYIDFAKGYYRQNGSTGEHEPIRRALIPLGEMFGLLRVNEFGPLKLKALRQRWIDEGRVRKQINAAVHRVVRCFKWGVENELVAGEVFHALRSVGGLRFGRSGAKESEPIRPVDAALVDAALPFMPAQVRSMVELQRHSGMRPGEAVQMTPAMIDRSTSPWEYRPARHKTQHHGRDRVVFLGPRCQALLAPYLDGREPDAPIFSPLEALTSIRAERSARRKTPRSYGNRPGTNVKSKPKWKPSATYTTASYQRAVIRACEWAFPLPSHLARQRREKVTAWKERIGEAGVAEAAAWRARYRWHPNQLRHSFATAVRKAHGLEAAQILLGHATADITQVYAERDAARAAAVAAQIG
jgi:hypothetical protein